MDVRLRARELKIESTDRWRVGECRARRMEAAQQHCITAPHGHEQDRAAPGVSYWTACAAHPPHAPTLALTGRQRGVRAAAQIQAQSGARAGREWGRAAMRRHGRAAGPWRGTRSLAVRLRWRARRRAERSSAEISAGEVIFDRGSLRDLGHTRRSQSLSPARSSTARDSFSIRASRSIVAENRVILQPCPLWRCTCQPWCLRTSSRPSGWRACCWSSTGPGAR